MVEIVALRSWNRRSVARGACALLTEADVRGFFGRHAWSIAELELAADDYEALREWGGRLGHGSAERLIVGYNPMGIAPDGSPFTESQGVGLLLLALTAEAARRQVDSGVVWPALANQSMQETTRKVLLTADGQPRNETRHCMGSAATRFGLRVPEEFTGHAWYRTVILQFGFSPQACQHQLARWLEHGPPSSLRPLLEGPQRSMRFERVWRLLQQHRRGEILAEDIRDELADSEWVLPDGLDVLLGAATKPSNPPLTLLETVRLVWDGPRAVLRATPSAVQGAELTDSFYRLLVDGQRCMKLLRDSRGTYRPASSHPVTLPPAATLSLSLVDRAGEVVRREALDVWSLEDDVTVYGPAGARLGERAPLPPTEATLVCTVDASIRPAPQQTARFGERGAARVRPPWERLELVWEDGASWRVDGRVAAARTPVTMCEPAAPGETARLEVVLADNEEVAAVTAPPDWSCEPNRRIIRGQLPVSTTTMWRGRVRLTNGASKSLLGRLDLEGCTYRRGAHWHVTGDRIEARDVRWLTWRIFAPEPPPGDALVVAGSTVVRRLRRFGVATSLGSAPGYGEPLSWVDARVYGDNGLTAVQLIDSIVDHGELHDAETTEQGIAFRLDTEIDPTEATVFAWTASGLRLLGDDMLTQSGGCWSLHLDGEAPIAVLIAFGEARIGAWWAENWCNHIDELVASVGAETAALFLRVARLPILAAESRENVRILQALHPVACARAWLLDGGEYGVALRSRHKPTGLAKPHAYLDSLLRLLGKTDSDAWWGTLRELWEGEPNGFELAQGIEAEDMSCALGQSIDSDGSLGWFLPVALLRLARIAPTWMRILLDADLDSGDRRVVASTRRSIANLEHDSPDDAVRRILDERIRRAAFALRIDSSRCELLAAMRATANSPISLRLAMHHSVFRDAATLLMLARVSQ